MKTAVIGSGSMGTALARLLADNGHSVSCWDHIPSVVEDIRKNHLNSKFLPGVDLPSSITADLLLNHVVREAQMVFIAVPSAFFGHVVKEFSPFSPPQAIVVGTSKGLEPSTGKRLSQVYAQAAVHPPDQYVALSGPSVAGEFAPQRPTAVVVAGSRSQSQKVSDALSNPYFHVEISDDLAGVELGGVLKNIYAIGFGFLDGLNQGSSNLKSAFLIKAWAELKGIGVKLGAQAKTFDGLAGLGELVTTGYSADSHNRKFGQLLASGLDYDKAVAQIGGAAPEGVRNLATLLTVLGNQMDTPLAKLIQTSIQQPAARAKFVEGILQFFNGSVSGR